MRFTEYSKHRVSTCEYCGEQYRQKRSDQKYCQPSCRVLACRERKGYEYQPRYVPAEENGEGLAGPDQQAGKKGVTAAGIGESAIGAVVGNMASEGLKSIFTPDIQKLIKRGDLEKAVGQITRNQKTLHDNQKLIYDMLMATNQYAKAIAEHMEAKQGYLQALDGTKLTLSAQKAMGGNRGS